MRKWMCLVVAVVCYMSESEFVLASKDLYVSLGIPRNADSTVIKRAYRKLSLKYHPDKAKGDKKAAETKFAEIARAYEVLSDKATRGVYDSQGEEGLKRHEKGGGGGGFDPFAMFRNFGGQQQQQENVGPSVEMILKVTLKDIYVGKTMQVMMNRMVPGESASKRERCRQCSYQTVQIVHRQLAPGFVQQVQQTVNKNFECCEEEDIIQVDIERGVPDGHVIEFEGYGEHNPEQTPGKVTFKVETSKDKTFRREGNDLHAEMSISLRDALLGFETTLTHVDGHKVRVKKEGVTHPGEIMRMPREGMPQYESPSITGDLLIQFTVLFPNKFDEHQRAKLAEIL